MHVRAVGRQNLAPGGTQSGILWLPAGANFTWQDNTVSLHLSVVRAASEVASLLTPRRGRAPAGALPVLRRIWLADFRSLTWQPRLHCGLTGDSAGRISPGLRQGAPAARAPLADVKQSLGRDSKKKNAHKKRSIWAARVPPRVRTREN